MQISEREKPGSGAPTTAPCLDLHCHLLPDWDDGPSNLEESLHMAREAVAAGVSGIFVTPHVGRSFGGRNRPAAAIAPALATLQTSLHQHGIELLLHSGAELLLGAVDLAGGALLPAEWTYGGESRYALLESPYGAWPDFGTHALRAVQDRGVTPIIAHPERYHDMVQNPDLLGALVEQGALAQVTAACLQGHQGKAAQAACRRFLSSGLAHFVASDAHRSGAIWPSDTMAPLTTLVGDARARQIVYENPAQVAQNLPLRAQLHAEEPETRSAISRLWRPR